MHAQPEFLVADRYVWLAECQDFFAVKGVGEGVFFRVDDGAVGVPVGQVGVFVVQLFLFVRLHATPVVGGVDVRVAHAAFGEVHFGRPVALAFRPEEEDVADAFGVGEAGAHFPAAAAGGVHFAAADAFA